MGMSKVHGQPCVALRRAPSELLHIDIKNRGRVDNVGHRITGDSRQRARHSGWDCVVLAVDDHSRVASTEVYATERCHGMTLSAKPVAQI